MTRINNLMGGIIFLLTSLVYGYYARTISLLPGDEFAPFNAQTLPIYLAVLCGTLSICLILKSLKREVSEAPPSVSLKNTDKGTFFSLVVLMLCFALAIEWLGFLLATISFLAAGFWIMGERRTKIIALYAIPFSLFIWFSLAKLLGIYLAPGKLFTHVIGGL